MVRRYGNPQRVSWVSGFFRLVLGGIFVVSGLAKIADPVRTLLTFREFQLLPGSMEVFLAVYIPWLEFILGLSTILGILYRSSAFLIAGLNTLFILAIGSLLVRGIKVDCGCFGLMADLLHLPDQADWKAIARNLVFIGMALFIARTEASPFCLENYLKKPGSGGLKI
jgi:putative oxidoreductase